MEVHIVVGNNGLRVGEPSIERGTIPGKLRRLQGTGILKGGNTASLAAKHVVQPWALLVCVERVASAATFFEQFFTADRVAGVRGTGEDCSGEEERIKATTA